MIAELRCAAKWLFLLMLLAGVVAPIYAQEGDEDPRLAALQSAGLLTNPDLRQTVDDFTFAIDWAYADPYLIMLGYSVTHPDVVFADEDAAIAYMPQGALTDTDGNILSFQSTWGDPVQLADGQSALRYVQTFNFREASQPTSDAEAPYRYLPDYFDDRYGDTPPDEVTLRFYGDILRLESVAMAPPPMISLEHLSDLPYQFEFTVPLQSALTMTPNLTQTASDLAMTLETVTLTPALAIARLCYDLPDDRDWFPRVTTLTVNDVPALLQGWGLVGLPAPGDTQRCTDVRYDVGHDQQPGTLTLTVERLTPSEPGTREYWNSVASELANHDIMIEVVMDGGRYYDLVSRPETMTDAEYSEILFAVRESLLPAVDGPWVFEVALP